MKMKTIKTYEELNNNKLALFIKDATYLSLKDIRVHEGDLIVDGDYKVFEDSSQKFSLYITGDLIVTGTIGFTIQRYHRSLLIGGKVRAKNFININADSIFVGKSLVIEELSFFTAYEYKLSVKEQIVTKDLIHYESYPKKIKFENAYSFSKDDYKVFNKEFFGEQNGQITFFFDKLIDALIGGESYLDQKKLDKLARKKDYEAKEEKKYREVQAREEKESLENPNYGAFKKFKAALESYAWADIELAGFKYVDNDIQAKILGLHLPEDQLLIDVRSRSGLYALIHAGRPSYIKPNKTTKKGFEFKALDLLNRYIDLKIFMMEKSDMYYKHVFYSLFQEGSPKELYTIEKTYFNIDKELGLYWLIVFGLLNDKRFDEVLESILHFNWDMIDGAKEYFLKKKQYDIVNAKEKMEFLEQFRKVNSKGSDD